MEERKVISSYISDKKMLQLIDILKAQGSIRFDVDFCDAIGLLKQNLVNIRRDKNHFTAEHIENTIKHFQVNANWIFGISDKIFLHQKSTIKSTLFDVKNEKTKTTTA